MSKMPALSRSFHSVSLKTLRRSVFLTSAVEGLKSGTAIRTFSTPKPVPVRIQSCARAGERSDKATANSAAIRMANELAFELSGLIIAALPWAHRIVLRRIGDFKLLTFIAFSQQLVIRRQLNPGKFAGRKPLDGQG